MVFFAVNVIIEKCNERDGIYCYRVDAIDCEQKFFVCINATKKQISYFSTADLKAHLGTIDLSDPDKSMEEVTGINVNVSNYVTFRAYRAIREIEEECKASFSEDIAIEDLAENIISIISGTIGESIKNER